MFVWHSHKKMEARMCDIHTKISGTVPLRKRGKKVHKK